MPGLSVHKAAENKQLSLVIALVEENPDAVNTLDDDGRIALHWAAAVGAADIASYLLEHRADKDAQDLGNWTPLHCASSAGHDGVVRELLGAGADPKKTNDKGLTPLHYAASKAHIQIGAMLLERGADRNAKDRAGQTSLHRAATTGSLGFVDLLLIVPDGSPKLRLNGGDRVGNTPLHLALESGHAEAAVKLIVAGADRERTNSDGEMAEQLQGVGGHEQQNMLKYVKEKCGPPPS